MFFLPETSVKVGIADACHNAADFCRVLHIRDTEKRTGQIVAVGHHAVPLHQAAVPALQGLHHVLRQFRAPVGTEGADRDRALSKRRHLQQNKRNRPVQHGESCGIWGQWIPGRRKTGRRRSFQYPEETDSLQNQQTALAE